MASPKPPRSPLNPGRPRASFRRSESSPEMQGYVHHGRLPPLPDYSPSPSPLKESFLRRDLPTLQEAERYNVLRGGPRIGDNGGATSQQDLPPHGQRSVQSLNSSSPRKNISLQLPPPSFRYFSRTMSPPPPPLLEVPAEGIRETTAKPRREDATVDHGSSVDFRRGMRLQGKGKGLGSASEWVVPLMVFSLVCLGTMITTLVYCLNIVENYKDNSVGVFFHISDIHLDPLYRASSGPSANCRGKAGNQSQPYGQYGCDSPLPLLQSALRQMASVSKKPDFILVTGDMSSFNLTSNDTLHSLMQVDLEIQNAFPDPITKILYAIGESELPSEWRTQPLTNSLWLSQLAAAWKDSLEEAGPDVMETFKKGGYYTSIIEARWKLEKNPEPTNMAVIVLNTLLYSVDVPDVDSSDLDPAGQLAWLAKELQQARHWKRKVLIAGHKPPGVKGLGRGPLWRSHFEDKYRKIILEYSDVVVGQLFGYLHRDQFRLMHPGTVLTSDSDISVMSSDAVGALAFPETASLHTSGSSADKDEIVDSQVRTKLGVFGIDSGEILEPREAMSGENASATEDELHRSLIGQLFRRSVRSSRRSHGFFGTWKKQVSRNQGQSDRWQAGGVSQQNVGYRVGSTPGRRRERGAETRVSATGGNATGSAMLMVPSLSPMYDNRPAFRLFRYDRWQLLLDFTEHTADLRESTAERMWGVEYGASATYGIPALDSASLKDLSSSFFNESGKPTRMFEAFCRLMAAGRQPGPNWGRESMECCEECPHHMHCSLEYATYAQYQSCQKRKFP